MESASRKKAKAVVSVILRVPALVALEVWFQLNFDFLEETVATVANYLSCFLVVFAVTVAAMPLQKLVDLYIKCFAFVLLLYAYHESKNFSQKTPGKYEKDFYWEFIIKPAAIQLFISSLLHWIFNPSGKQKVLLGFFLLPIVAKATTFETEIVHFCHLFAMMAYIIMTILYLIYNIPNVIRFARYTYLKVSVTTRVFGWMISFFTYVHHVYLPIQLTLFWACFCFSCFYANYNRLPKNFMLMVLTAIGQSCGTPISLIAFCFTISYIAAFLQVAVLVFLNGWQAGTIQRDTTRGWAEGITMMLIAVQTGILDLKTLERVFLMSVLLFIVASTLMQSIYEMSEPILLSLSASQNPKKLKHLRAVLLFTFLWMFPLYMTYSVCQYFDLDFWLLMIMSSCLLTTVQSLGALFMYTLFLYDSLRAEPWDALEDMIYYTRCVLRILEFSVAVFIVCYGIKETISRDWSYMNVSILVIHFYFNVWKRLQQGWNSYLLRREAVKRIESLKVATEDQLRNLKDVCPICYSDMMSARITPCGHFFHGPCLKKWLYVQDTCPMCHTKIDTTAPLANNESHVHSEEQVDQVPADELAPEEGNIVVESNTEEEFSDDGRGDNS